MWCRDRFKNMGEGYNYQGEEGGDEIPGQVKYLDKGRARGKG